MCDEQPEYKIYLNTKKSLNIKIYLNMKISLNLKII